MPRKHRRPRRRRRRKLADKKINTLVEKRMQEIAQKEDRKQLVKYVTQSQVKHSTFDWNADDYYFRLPVIENWFKLSGQMLLSDKFAKVGQQLGLKNQLSVGNNQQKSLKLRVHAVESIGVVENRSALPVRVEIRLIYVPNNNGLTTATGDLQPAIEWFARDRAGLGVIRFQGMAHSELALLTDAAAPKRRVQYQQIARKVLYLPPGFRATDTTNDAGEDTLGTISQPVRKRWNIRKFYKRRFMHIRGEGGSSSAVDGNYFCCIWTDLPIATDSVRILACNNAQFSIAAPRGVLAFE